jgi:hypothetical protein
MTGMNVERCQKYVTPVPNPTIAIYNATGSLARFENKNIFFYFEKRWRCM